MSGAPLEDWNRIAEIKRYRIVVDWTIMSFERIAGRLTQSNMPLAKP